jgi:hypothetical protein
LTHCPRRLWPIGRGAALDRLTAMNGAISNNRRTSASTDSSVELLRRSLANSTLREVREVRLPVHNSSVGIARVAVAAVLADWGLFTLECPADDTILADTVVECVSELVTNAIRHPKCPRWDEIAVASRFVYMRIHLIAGWLLVEVEDCDPKMPTITPPLDIEFDNLEALEKLPESGRGLWTVDQLLNRWHGRLGAWTLPRGKAVWIEIPVLKAAIEAARHSPSVREAVLTGPSGHPPCRQRTRMP